MQQGATHNFILPAGAAYSFMLELYDGDGAAFNLVDGEMLSASVLVNGVTVLCSVEVIGHIATVVVPAFELVNIRPQWGYALYMISPDGNADTLLTGYMMLDSSTPAPVATLSGDHLRIVLGSDRVVCSVVKYAPVNVASTLDPVSVMVPTSKAVADYVATHGGEPLPVWMEDILSDVEGIHQINFEQGASIFTRGASTGDIIIQPARNSHTRLANVDIHGSATLNEVALATVDDIKQGLLEVVWFSGLDPEVLSPGKMYDVVYDAVGFYLSDKTFIAPSGECWTCELKLDFSLGSSVTWPTTWYWLDTPDGLPPANLAVGKVHYFALRSEGARTYINKSYEL